jgi:signal transduction histidine kinase
VRSDLQVSERLNKNVKEALLPVSLGLAILYTAYTIGHLFLKESYAFVMAGVAAASAAIYVGLALFLSKRELPPRMIQPTAFAIAMLVLLNSAVHLWLSADPQQTTNLVLLNIGVGLLFLSWTWFALVMACVWAVWLIIVSVHGSTEADWMHFGFALLGGTVLATMVHAVRIHNWATVERAREQERQRTLQLEEATKKIELINRNLEVSVRERTESLTRTVVALKHEILRREGAESALLMAERIASAGRIAATLAHEINNPLGALMNLMYLARLTESLPPQLRELLEMADSELRRLAHIAQQSLSFYRENHRPAIIDVSELIEGLRFIYGPKLTERDAKLRVEDCSRGSMIFSYEGELKQLFSNLILNSIDAIDRGGKIVVRVKAAKSFHGAAGVFCFIHDNGRGIPAEVRERMFEPFFSTKGERGTGLGLWVAHGIIQRQGGFIRVRSNVAHTWRTSFLVYMPAAVPLRRREDG